MNKQNFHAECEELIFKCSSGYDLLLNMKSINGIAPSREDDDILQQTSCLIAYNYSQHLAINYFAYKTIDLNLPASHREKNTSQIGTT